MHYLVCWGGVGNTFLIQMQVGIKVDTREKSVQGNGGKVSRWIGLERNGGTRKEEKQTWWKTRGNARASKQANSTHGTQHYEDLRFTRYFTADRERYPRLQLFGLTLYLSKLKTNAYATTKFGRKWVSNVLFQLMVSRWEGFVVGIRAHSLSSPFYYHHLKPPMTLTD